MDRRRLLVQSCVAGGDFNRVRESFLQVCPELDTTKRKKKKKEEEEEGKSEADEGNDGVESLESNTENNIPEGEDVVEDNGEFVFESSVSPSSARTGSRKKAKTKEKESSGGDIYDTEYEEFMAAISQAKRKPVDDFSDVDDEDQIRKRMKPSSGEV